MSIIIHKNHYFNFHTYVAVYPYGYITKINNYVGKLAVYPYGYYHMNVSIARKLVVFSGKKQLRYTDKFIICYVHYFFIHKKSIFRIKIFFLTLREEDACARSTILCTTEKLGLPATHNIFLPKDTKNIALFTKEVFKYFF